MYKLFEVIYNDGGWHKNGDTFKIEFTVKRVK